MLIFSLEPRIFGVVIQKIHQTAKNGGFCEESLRNDSKFEMCDGKRPLEVKGEGVKGLGVEKFNYCTKYNTIHFPICCQFQILNNTQT